MAQLFVRDLDTKTVERLKTRAKQHGRSLQGEVKVILIEATALSLREARGVSAPHPVRTPLDPRPPAGTPG